MPSEVMSLFVASIFPLEFFILRRYDLNFVSRDERGKNSVSTIGIEWSNTQASPSRAHDGSSSSSASSVQPPRADSWEVSEGLPTSPLGDDTDAGLGRRVIAGAYRFLQKSVDDTQMLHATSKAGYFDQSFRNLHDLVAFGSQQCIDLGTKRGVLFPMRRSLAAQHWLTLPSRECQAYNVVLPPRDYDDANESTDSKQPLVELAVNCEGVALDSTLASIGLGVCFEFCTEGEAAFVAWVRQNSSAQKAGLMVGMKLTDAFSALKAPSKTFTGLSHLTMKRALEKLVQGTVEEDYPEHVHEDEVVATYVRSFTLSFVSDAATLPSTFLFCKDWHITATLAEYVQLQHSWQTISNTHAIAVRKAILHSVVKSASGPDNAHQDRQVDPYPYDVIFGNPDVGDAADPVYILFHSGRASRHILKQPMLFAECTGFPGKVNLGVAKFAKRCPLEPFVALLRLWKRSKGKPRRLVFCGHGLGGAVAQLTALRLLAFVEGDGLNPMEEPSTGAANTGDGASFNKQDRLSLMSRVAVFAFASPFVGDTAFAKASQRLINKCHASFTFFEAYDDKIPFVISVLSELSSEVHQAYSTEQTDVSPEDMIERFKGMKALYRQMSASLSHLLTRKKQTDTKKQDIYNFSSSYPKTNQKGGIRNDADNLMTQIAALVRERDTVHDIGAFGNWFRFDQNHRACAVYPSDVLETLFLQWGGSWERARSITAESLIKMHALSGFVNPFGAEGSKFVANPFLLNPAKVPSELGGSTLCHESRFEEKAHPDLSFIGVQKWSKQWGVPTISAMMDDRCSVIKRPYGNNNVVQKLTLVFTGMHLKFVTKVKLQIKRGRESNECAPDVTTTNEQLRVSVEINTAESVSLSAKQVVIKLRGHFGSWLEHTIQLPAELRELQTLSLRESRVASLELGLLLNEAVLQCSLDTKNSQMRDTLTALEVTPSTPLSRFTPAARQHFKRVSERVTDLETGNLLEGVEEILTFSISGDQLARLGDTLVAKGGDGAGKDLKTFVAEYDERSQTEGHAAASQHSADFIGNDIKANAEFQKLLAANQKNAGRHTPDLMFGDALCRHKIPSYVPDARWGLFEKIDGHRPLPAPANTLNPDEIQQLELHSSLRQHQYNWVDQVSQTFGPAFEKGKRARADFIKGTLEIELSITPSLPRARLFTRPECVVVPVTQLAIQAQQGVVGSVRYMGLHDVSRNNGQPSVVYKLPYLWNITVTLPEKSKPWSTETIELSVAVTSLVTHAKKRRHTSLYIGLRDGVLWYNFDRDSDLDTVDIRDAAATGHHSVPGLVGDEFLYMGYGDDQTAVYVIDVLQEQNVSMLSAMPAPQAERTIVCVLWEHQRKSGPFMDFSAGSLAPRIYQDPPAYHIFYATDDIPFTKDGKSDDGTHGWATQSPFSDDIRLPSQIEWLDSEWHLDHGALGVYRMPLGAVASRDSKHIPEGDIQNLGQRTAEVDDNGWSYNIDFSEKSVSTAAIVGWRGKKIKSPFQVRRRRWLRRVKCTNLQESWDALECAPATPSNPCHVDGVEAQVAGQLMAHSDLCGTSTKGKVLYFVLFRHKLCWYPTEPHSVFELKDDSFKAPGEYLIEDFEACMPVDDQKRARLDEYDAEFILTIRLSNRKKVEVVLCAIDELSRAQWLSILKMHTREQRENHSKSARTLSAGDDILSSSISLRNVRTKKTFRLVRDGSESGRGSSSTAVQVFNPDQEVVYLPLVSDVQLAVWRGVRRILARFAMAGLPNPKRWTNTIAIVGGIAAAGVIVFPAAGFVAASATLVSASIGMFWATAAASAMSALGRYIVDILDKEQQLYQINLVIACQLLGIHESDHGREIYFMEKCIDEKVTVITQGDDLEDATPLKKLVLDDDLWHRRFSGHARYRIGYLRERDRREERERIAEFLHDVVSVFQLRQELIRSFKMGVVGPMKAVGAPLSAAIFRLFTLFYVMG